MKKLMTGAFCTLGILLSAALACGQTFTTSSGYSAQKLFDSVAGTTIAGIDVDASGNIYTLEGDFNSPTVIYRRSAADGYATPTVFYTFSQQVFGTFVRVRGDTIYFGDSSTNQIYGKALGDADPATATVISTVPGNYDLKFAGLNAYLSYNPGGFSAGETKVALLNLGSGDLDTIVDTSDYSGPIAFDARGALFYGATTFNAGSGGPSGGIFQFDAAEVASATGPTALTLPGTAFIDNGSNQFLSYDGGTGLFQSYSAGFGGVPATVSLYDIDSKAAAAVAVSGDDEFLGGISFVNGTLFAALTDASFSSTSVFAIVPEPSVSLLLGLGLTVFLRRRRAEAAA